MLFVSGLGGGLAATGIGVGLWSAAKKANDDYRAAAQNSPQANSLASKGKKLAIIGDIFVFMGAAGAVVNTLVYVTWWPKVSTREVLEKDGTTVSVAPLRGGAAMSAAIRF